MLPTLSEAAKQVLVRAEQVARGLNHPYVGTEHILLALLDDGFAETMGINEKLIRAELRVRAGMAETLPAKLPLTPRAKLAIEFARHEVALFEYDCVEPPHLLLGLVREPDGLASKALASLRVKADQIRRRVFRIRLAQFKLIERVVRPIRAGLPRKQKIREELLAHLTGIYEQELDRLKNLDAAQTEAARRFGDPAELSRKLDAQQSSLERANHVVERYLNWRAGETAGQYMFRLATGLFFLLAGVALLLAATTVARFEWGKASWIILQPAALALALIPVVVYVQGVLYFKMRDSLWGVFGSRRSLAMAFSFAVLMAVALGTELVVFAASVLWHVSPWVRWLPYTCAAAVLGSAAMSVQARFAGPAEIRRSLWASLDLSATD